MSSSSSLPKKLGVPGLPKNFDNVLTAPTNLEDIDSLTLTTDTQFGNLYTLYYRHGFSVSCSKGFIHEGGLKSAITRAIKHCEIMGYKYIFVRPMVSNIDEEESLKRLKVA